MSGPTGDIVWVDVLPSLDKFAPVMRAGLGAATGIAAQSGATAGGAFGKSFGDSAAIALDSAAAKVGAANKRMADATGQLSVALAKLRDLMDQDNVSASRLAAANEAVAKAQRNVQLTSDASSTALKQQATVRREVSDAALLQTKSVETATARTDESNLATKALTGTMGLATKALTVGFGAALVGIPFIAAIRDAQSFDRQMTLVQTQAGASAEEVKKLTPAVLALAGKTAQAPEELALSLYHVESTGIRGAAAIDVVGAAARFATVAHANLEETTNALTSSVASGIPGFHNMNEAIGILNATVGSGDMKLSDLNEALGSGLLTIVKTYGITMRDVAAALATFGDNNIRGALAATDLRLAVQALAVPSKQGRGELAALGLSADTLAKDMQTGGLNKAIADLKEHLDRAGISGVQTGQVLTEVFGKKAGPGLAILVSQFDRLQSKYTEVNRQADEFGAAWDRTTKTAAFSFQSLLDSMKAVAIIVGNAVLPILTKVANAVSEFFSGAIAGTGAGGAVVKAFKDLFDAVGQLVGVFKPLAEALLPALGKAFGALVTVLESSAHWYDQHKTLINSLIIAVGAFTLLIYAQTIAMAAWAVVTGVVNGVLTAFKVVWLAVNILFAASPIGFIVTLLAALAAGLVYAYTQSATFRKIVSEVLDAVTNAFKVAIGWIVDHWKLLVAAIPGLGPVILGVIEVVQNFGTIWQKIIGGLKAAWDTVSGAFVTAWNVVWGGLSGAFHAAVDGITTFWHNEVQGWVNIWNAVSGALTSAWNTVWGGLSGAFQAVIGAITSAWNTFWRGLVAIWQAVEPVLQGIGDVLAQIGKVVGIVLGVLVLTPIALAWKGIQEVIKGAAIVIQAVWDGMQTAWNFLWTQVLQPAWIGLQVAWQAVGDVIRTVYNVAILPIWVAMQVAARFMWDNVLNPVWQLIKQAWNDLAAAFSFVWNSIIKPVFDAVGNAAKAMADFIVQQWNAFAGQVRQLWTTLTSFLTVLWTGFRDGVVHLAEDIWHFIVDRFTQFQAAVQLLWTNLTNFVTGLWTRFRDAVVQIAQDIWNFIVDRFNRFRDAVVLVWTNLTSFVTGIWTGFRDTVVSIAQQIWDTLSSKFKNMAGDFSHIWSILVDGIRSVWNTVEEVVGTPINFVIEYVFNKGLFNVWNWIVGTLGLPGNWKANPFPQIGAPAHQFAEGGFTGRGMFGSGDKYDPAGIVHAGEFVHTQDKTRKFRPLFEAIHSGMLEPSDLGFAAGGFVPVLPGYATGGLASTPQSQWTWPELNQIREKMFPGSVLTDAYRPGANDYHGAGQAIDIGWAGNDYQHLFDIAAALTRAFPNSTELIHDPNGSIKNGQPVPPGYWGTQTWLAHANHVHWAMTQAALANGNPNAGGVNIVQNPLGFFGEVWNSIADVLGDLQKAIAGPVGQMAQFGNSPFVQEAEQIPGAVLGKMWDAVKGAVGQKLQVMLDAAAAAAATVAGVGGGTPGQVNAAGIKGEAFQVAGQEFGWQSAQDQQNLDYIATHESNWNPTAQNKVSSASGIWQLIDATWQAYKNAGPWSHAREAPTIEQDRAAFRYIRSRYGDPITAGNYWRAHGNYDEGGLWPSGTPGWNGTGADERVLSPSQDNYFREFVDATSGRSGGDMPAPIWHFKIGDRELNDLVDARVTYQINQDARNFRSTR